MIYTDSEFLNSIALFFYNHLPDVLNLNLTASIVILFVICVRQFLKRAPKIFSYALWGIVLLRLLVPVSIESPMSFVPERTEFTSMVDVNEALPEIEFQTAEDRLDNKRQMEISPTGDPMVLSHSIVEPQHYLTMIWIAGILFLSVRSLLAYLGLRERVKVSVPLQKGVYIADDIDTPFVMGFFRPRIYLPSILDSTEQKYIIAHERHHIRRGDHIFKALGFLALTIHWFNPFVWVAFVLAGRDMEMSCDEAVIRKLGEDVRAEYSASLLNLATGKRMFAGTPLAFDEGDPTERVRNLARWKKPAVWVILICLTVCAFLAVCLLTDPESNFPHEFRQYFVTGSKAELLSGITNDRSSKLNITFESTSGPKNLELELWYHRNSDDQWIQKDSHVIALQGNCTFTIPADSTFAIAATAEGGQNGYATIKLSPGQGLVFDEFKHDLLLDTRTKSSSEEACAWTVPEEAVAVPEMTEASDLSDTYNWGVSLKPDRVSRTGATALFVYGGSVPGQEGAELSYGDFLSLDRRVDGEWVPVDELAGYDYFVGDSSYPVVDGYGMVHEWPDRFGELVDGTYRMGKLVRLSRPDGSWEERTIFGEFSIPDSILSGPIPLEDLPEKYGAEQAAIDGCLVTRDGEVSENLAVLKDFIETTSRGEPAFIRIVNWYYGEESYYTAEDLTFDGSQYILEWIEDGRRQSRSYRYLKHFSGEKERENIAYDAYEHYVLVNDNSVSWQQIWESLISSQYGASIDHWTICSDYIYYTKHPDLPDKPNYAVLEFMDEGLVTVLDGDRLEKLIFLFENGEYLGYEPKTHSVGVGLKLIFNTNEVGFATGNGDFVIELDPDSDICRINGEYVWYGKADEPEYTYKLWDYLGITQWPDIVYTVCENALRP